MKLLFNTCVPQCTSRYADYEAGTFLIPQSNCFSNLFYFMDFILMAPYSKFPDDPPSGFMLLLNSMED